MSSEIVVLKSLPGIWVEGRLEIPCQLGIGKKGKDVVLLAESARMGHHLVAFRVEHLSRFLHKLALLKEQDCELATATEGRITICLRNGAATLLFSDLEIKGVSLVGLTTGLIEVQKRCQKGRGGGAKGEGQLPGEVQSRGFYQQRNGRNGGCIRP